MKKIPLLLLLFIYTQSYSQNIDSAQIFKSKNNKTKISFRSPFRDIPKYNAWKLENLNIEKSTYMPEYYTQKVENNIQQNLNQLNSRYSVNPYQLPKTLTNPTGASSPKQALINGLFNSIKK